MFKWCWKCWKCFCKNHGSKQEVKLRLCITGWWTKSCYFRWVREWYPIWCWGAHHCLPIWQGEACKVQARQLLCKATKRHQVLICKFRPGQRKSDTQRSEGTSVTCATVTILIHRQEIREKPKCLLMLYLVSYLVEKILMLHTQLFKSFRPALHSREESMPEIIGACL